MSLDARVQRYFTGMPRLPATMLAALADVDGVQHAAWLASVDERPVGVGRYAVVEPGVAELAFEVTDAHRGTGIGTLLLDTVTTVAVAHGVRRVRASLLPDNGPSRSLVTKVGVRLSPPAASSRVRVRCGCSTRRAWTGTPSSPSPRRVPLGVTRRGWSDRTARYGPCRTSGGRVMLVQVRLLGRFEVVVDGRTVPARDWRRQSASRLVKLLALQPSRRLHREQVIDALWPDVALDTGGTRLHTAAHYARTALGEHTGIVVSQGSVALFPEADVEVDVSEFERAAAAALDADPAAAAVASALHVGPLLPEDLYEPWTEEPRDRLRLQYRELLRAAGRYDALVADDPLDEDAQVDLARDLLRRGRRRDALVTLDRMAEVFERDLGVDPPEAAQELRAEALAMPAGTEPSPYAGSPSPRPRPRCPPRRCRRLAAG